jgi:hypothetical protein
MIAINSKRRRGGKKRLLQALSTAALDFAHLAKQTIDVMHESSSDSDSDSDSDSYESTDAETTSDAETDSEDTLSSDSGTSSSSSSSSDSSDSSSSSSSSSSSCLSSDSDSSDSSDLDTEEEDELDDLMDSGLFYKQAASATHGLADIIRRVSKRRRLDPEPVAKSSQIPLVLEEFKANDHDRFRRNLRGVLSDESWTETDFTDLRCSIPQDF